jgi:hypothetical protein
MVRQPSFRVATFSKNGGTPKMSDLKAPTYKLTGAVADTLKNVLTTWLESKRLIGSLLAFDTGQILKSPRR